MKRPTDFWKCLVRLIFSLSHGRAKPHISPDRHLQRLSLSSSTCSMAVLFMYFWNCFRKGLIWYLVLQAFQGQFALPISYQGISVYLWQTVGQLHVFLSLHLAVKLMPQSKRIIACRWDGSHGVLWEHRSQGYLHQYSRRYLQGPSAHELQRKVCLDR
jgi:hypothetical protein